MEFKNEIPAALAALGLGVALVWLITFAACKLYAEAIAEGRDGEAGFWGFLALGS